MPGVRTHSSLASARIWRRSTLSLGLSRQDWPRGKRLSTEIESIRVEFERECLAETIDTSPSLNRLLAIRLPE